MKESPREVKISLTAAAILLHNIFVASKDDRIGIVDADQTLQSLVSNMEKDVWVKTEILESALYYSNIMSEDHNFWHPMGTTFPTFLKRTLPKEIEFDTYYNLLSIKEEEDV